MVRNTSGLDYFEVRREMRTRAKRYALRNKVYACIATTLQACAITAVVCAFVVVYMTVFPD